jgi:ABC-type microcin C transport system permease subunit YejE
LQPSSTTNTAPTPSISSNPTSSQTNTTNYWLSLIALTVIAFLLAVIVFLLLYIRKRRTTDSKAYN